MVSPRTTGKGLPVPGPGRNSAYQIEYAEQARKLCLLGYTDAELAGFFGVCADTIYEWKRQYPAFSEAIAAGKEKADAEVADSLYHRATGQTVLIEKAIKKDDGSYETMKLSQFIPGDVQAQRLWLLNRRKFNWRDKIEHEHGGKIEHEHSAKAETIDSILSAVEAAAQKGAE